MISTKRLFSQFIADVSSRDWCFFDRPTKRRASRAAGSAGQKQHNSENQDKGRPFGAIDASNLEALKAINLQTSRILVQGHTAGIFKNVIECDDNYKQWQATMESRERKYKAMVLEKARYIGRNSLLKRSKLPRRKAPESNMADYEDRQTHRRDRLQATEKILKDAIGKRKRALDEMYLVSRAINDDMQSRLEARSAITFNHSLPTTVMEWLRDAMDARDELNR